MSFVAYVPAGQRATVETRGGDPGGGSGDGFFVGAAAAANGRWRGDGRCRASTRCIRACRHSYRNRRASASCRSGGSREWMIGASAAIVAAAVIGVAAAIVAAAVIGAAATIGAAAAIGPSASSAE